MVPCLNLWKNSLIIRTQQFLHSFHSNSVDKLDQEKHILSLAAIKLQIQKNLHQFEYFMKAQERGIISRALETIFEAKEKNEIVYWISFMEVYNEKIFDLFNNEKSFTPLDIRESKAGEVQIPELTHVNVNSFGEAIDWILLGINNRIIGSSHANRHSSRSHCIFQILRVAKDTTKGTMKCLSALRIVDLAGSEKCKMPRNISKEEKEIRLQELTSINGSLSTLGHCISALEEKNRIHIPYRNSKLTRVLANCFNGNSQIYFVICVSPCSKESQETLSTLHFAKSAKNAILEERKAPKLKSAMTKKYEEIRDAYEKERTLREELEKNLNSQDRVKMESEIELLKKENKRLKQELTNLRSINASPVMRSKTPASHSKKVNSASKNTSGLFTRDISYEKSVEKGSNKGEAREKGEKGETVCFSKIKEFWGEFPKKNSLSFIKMEVPPQNPAANFQSEQIHKFHC